MPVNTPGTLAARNLTFVIYPVDMTLVINTERAFLASPGVGQRIRFMESNLSSNVTNSALTFHSKSASAVKTVMAVIQCGVSNRWMESSLAGITVSSEGDAITITPNIACRVVGTLRYVVERVDD